MAAGIGVSSNKIRHIFFRYQVPLMGVLGIIILGLAWQLVSDFKIIDPLFISSPAKIGRQFIISLQNGMWFRDLTASIWEFMVAYALAVAVGVPLGLLCGRYRYLEYSIDPFVWLLYSTPLIAIYPILIGLLGMGPSVVITLSFFLSVVPAYTNAFTGVKTVSQSLVRCAKSFGAGDGEIFYKIILPASVPLIIAGLRLAVGRALLGVVLGEMFGASAGVGFRLGYAGGKLQVASYFVALLTVMLIGIVLTQLLKKVETHFSVWRAQI